MRRLAKAAERRNDSAGRESGRQHEGVEGRRASALTSEGKRRLRLACALQPSFFHGAAAACPAFLLLMLQCVQRVLRALERV